MQDALRFLITHLPGTQNLPICLAVRWAALVGALLIGSTPLEAAEPARPNIIVILADDLGYNDVGFTGATDIQTPVLDELARDGVIFRNGYVSHPYCGPSRAALLTGRYQARFGMENNVAFAPSDPHMGLPLSEKTIADRLKQAGYHTAIFGKWHLGAAPHFQPTRRGFDYFYGFLDGGHQYMPGEVVMHRGGYWEPLIRNEQPERLDEYLTTALSRDAAKFIRRQGAAPFFLFMSYNAPHTPLQAPDSFVRKYAHVGDPERRIYAAMVDAMDEGIGMIVEALKERGTFDDTLIFFLSDNGGVYPEAWQPTSDWADNSPFRRGKVALLEGGVHVPFLAHWPKAFPGGRHFDGLVSALDIAATSAALAGADTSDGMLEGVHLIPFLDDRKKGSPHSALYWRLEEADGLWAVRTPEAKYMRQTLPGVGDAFFDLQRDPYESRNIFGERPAEQKRLAALWNAWNAKNIANILPQAHDYDAMVAKFHDEHYAARVEQSRTRKTFVAR